MAETQEEQATVEADGPMGIKVRVRNIRAQDILLIAMILGCTFFLWYYQNTNRASYLEQHKMTQTLLSNVISNQALILKAGTDGLSNSEEQTRALTYVLSLSQQERANLNLTMPQSLRRQINETRVR